MRLSLARRIGAGRGGNQVSTSLWSWLSAVAATAGSNGLSFLAAECRRRPSCETHVHSALKTRTSKSAPSAACWPSDAEQCAGDEASPGRCPVALTSWGKRSEDTGRRLIRGYPTFRKNIGTRFTASWAHLQTSKTRRATPKPLLLIYSPLTNWITAHV